MKTKSIIKAEDAECPKEPTDAQKSKETPAQQVQARKAMLKSKIADATEETYPDGESHGAKRDANEQAAYAHMHAADLASAGPVKDFHKAAADCHMEAAAEHAKVTAKNGEDAKVVKATGNSDGAQSGHATKKSDAAATASTEAYEMSARAHESGEDDDHGEAAAAHEKASDMHSAAMIACAKCNDKEGAENHAAIMAAHDACADAHNECQSADMIEASLKVIGEFVKAGGPGSGPHAGVETKKGHSGSINTANGKIFFKHDPSSDNFQVTSENKGGGKTLQWEGKLDRSGAGDNGKALPEVSYDHDNDKLSVKTANTHQIDLNPDWSAPSRVKASRDQHEAKDIIHCRANAAKIVPSKPWSLGEPVSFMYMPGGISTITAGFRDKAINITVDVDEDAAKTVQASYENLRQNLPKQQPFGCIEHREEEASVRASGDSVFAWGEYDGDEGIIITAEPTKLGMDNVNGKVHRSWSPSFATDADYSKAKLVGGVYTFPEGVRGSTSNPARITGIDFCFGTLTNKPAFRNMPPVKAKLNGDTIQAGGPGSGPRPSGFGPNRKGEFNDKIPDKSEIMSRVYKPKGEYYFQRGEDAMHLHVDSGSDANGVLNPSATQRYNIEKVNKTGEKSSMGYAHEFKISRKVNASDHSTLETIFARLEQPSAVDIVFANLRRQSIGEPVTAVTADDVFNRLAGKKVMAGGPGSGPRPKIGDSAKISEGSGPDSGKEVTIVHPSKIKTDGRGVPTNVSGAYKPIDWSKEHAVQYADGSYGTMFKNRLSVIEKAKASESKSDSSTILARLEQSRPPAMK